MRILVLNCDYPGFLDWLYGGRPGLAASSYDDQMRARNESRFGIADFYSKNLRSAGCEAWDVHANNRAMQYAWAREHGVKLPAAREWGFGFLKRRIPRSHGADSGRWFFEALQRQVEHYKPDVLLNTSMDCVPASFLKTIKPKVRFLAGQIAAPLPAGEDFTVYDLIVSSLPNFVQHFRSLGVRAEYLAFAFEPGAAIPRPPSERDIPVSFVGSFYSHHAGRIRLLEHLCESLPVAVWGQGVETLPPGSPIRARYRGQAWGAGMYEVLSRSKVTLNGHIDVSEDYANNMRLFEATGAGALLVTDEKKNLAELFAPGREVLTYRTPEECARVLRDCLMNESEREAVASAGHRKTLSEHTYGKRMRELLGMLPA